MSAAAELVGAAPGRLAAAAATAGVADGVAGLGD
jgi:hypothetical protein